MRSRDEANARAERETSRFEGSIERARPGGLVEASTRRRGWRRCGVKEDVRLGRITSAVSPEPELEEVGRTLRDVVEGREPAVAERSRVRDAHLTDHSPDMPVRVSTEHVGHQPGVQGPYPPFEDHRASERDLRSDLDAPAAVVLRARPESVGGVRGRDLRADPDRCKLRAESNEREQDAHSGDPLHLLPPSSVDEVAD